MILSSPHPDLLLPDVSFSEYVLRNIQKHGNEIALISADDNGKAYTYSELYESVLRCAGALFNLGVKKGDVVAVALGNRAEFPIIVLATAACGAILTTCNPNYTADEITKQFLHSKPSVVFVESGGLQTMIKVAEEAETIKQIFTAEKHSRCKSVWDLIAETGRKDFPFDVRPETKETPFYLPYSSGTTGLPKGVVLTHSNMVAIVALTGLAFAPSKKDCYYLVLPLFHIYGTMTIFTNLIQGIKTVLQRRFSVESFLHCVQEYKVTKTTAVPPMILAIYNSPLLSKYDTSSLQSLFSGAAPLPETVGFEVMKKLNLRVVQGWGLTEAVPLTATKDEQTPLKSIGKVIQNTKIKVVDTETGQELNCNENGEICVKGPQVMKGYYKNPEATAGCIDVDGWFHTGDIGYFDKFGHIYIIDRLKELIKVKGFQVAPAELEELLLRHPSVTDVAVIGIPDLKSGELPQAYLVVNDRSVTENDIHKFIEGRVSPYKYLKGGVVFCDVIPKSASGKILRRELRARAAAKAKL
uniref:Luciferin 4-monooxygenase n=1 Tax=Phallusia mammillata TaxID=59560 RepID=A0A6F9D6G5_9ASCI|nr:4-coumarate--CoA ligase 1-like [Phallusia mammillata]